MKYPDLLRASDADDLKLLLDAIAVYWRKVPKAERQLMGDVGKLVDSVVAHRRRLDQVSPEQTSALRRSAEHILEELAGMDPDEIIEEASIVHHGDHFENGLYWLFRDGSYVRCDDHMGFAIDNQSTFIDMLGLDGWSVMRARHTSGGEMMRLILSSGGAVAVQIFGEKTKKGKYQCCQKSLYWLKRKLSNMPMISNIVRVYDPSKEYLGFDDGIKFILHRE